MPKAWSWSHFGSGTGPILLDRVQCTGNELSLEECPHTPWGQHNCDHMEDAGVSCNPYTGEHNHNKNHVLNYTIVALSNFLFFFTSPVNMNVKVFKCTVYIF